MPIPDSIRYLIEALRTPAAEASVTPRTGPDAGIRRPSANPNLAPIEQRRDGYRLYMQNAQQNGEPVMPYSQWIMQEQ